MFSASVLPRKHRVAFPFVFSGKIHFSVTYIIGQVAGRDSKGRFDINPILELGSLDGHLKIVYRKDSVVTPVNVVCLLRDTHVTLQTVKLHVYTYVKNTGP